MSVRRSRVTGKRTVADAAVENPPETRAVTDDEVADKHAHVGMDGQEETAMHKREEDKDDKEQDHVSDAVDEDNLFGLSAEELKETAKVLELGLERRDGAGLYDEPIEDG